MKVLYDYQIFASQKHGGISRYFYELMQHGNDLFTCNIAGRYSINEYINKLNYLHFPPINTNVALSVNKNVALMQFKKGDYDVIHPTYYDPYIVQQKNTLKCPYVITVYDMIHELFMIPDPITVLNKRKIIENADAVIAISENTKRDLLHIYRFLSPDNIHVIHLGTSFCLTKNKNLKKTSKYGNYILFVGDRAYYKNFGFFAVAIAPLLGKYDLQLVCTGRAFNEVEKSLLLSLDIFDRTKQLTVSDDGLSTLYANALCFVYPSLYEGFGLPILEAFSANCPVVLSMASCFPEIAGEAAEYFDPFSADEMYNAIEKVILSSSRREELIAAGQVKLQNFSWRKCAEETLDVYRSVVK